MGLLALIAMGVSFIASVVALFSGKFLAAIGLFILSAIFNGVAKHFKA